MGATCFQLRLARTQNNIAEIAKKIAPIVQDLGIAFIVVDDTELAKQCGADGIHLETPTGDNGNHYT